ncbi:MULTISPECIES: TonB-dependent receptor domain-containing protein [Alteromonadaceae]|jgi:outer membrane receptor protein involved in Fe transport|uniref:TonB-dependent receptor n=1 Tax=Brumicola blandensis TaxID=3075611 RepID=A0AAW8R0T5_9ALTE|nr:MULTISPECIES: TonB-dependent receptor [unclassified Alteromonas]MDT0582901.1 TonB-dependent receptor [Alteromonas sp. W409]MDT0628317.1 TonB-dependent receptor [Alteromonas sp. W364]
MFTNTKLAKSVKLACLFGAASTAGIATNVAAQAEEGANTVEKIQVVGSRIKRQELTSVTPVVEVTDFEFDISGNLNIEQKLNELPSTLPAFGPSSNNPGDGTATVNLRGLGTARTLVLVNGRRWVPSRQDGVIDLNTIPASLIEKVDIITGGASAVYGSDALGGVVNFDLVDDFEGVEFSALYDITGDGDGEKFNFDITMGGNFADGKGNAVVYMGYSERKPVFQADRSFSDVALTESGGVLVPGGSSGVPGTRVFGGPTLPNGEVLGIFEPDGSGRAFQDPADRFNYAPDNFLQLPQTRHTVQAFAHYYLADEARLYGEMTFVRNEVPQELAPTPAFLSSLEVNPDSPFFGAGVQTALDGERTDTNGDGIVDGDDNAFLGFIGRRMVENGSRQSVDTRDAFRVLIGVDGAINDYWNYDVYLSRSILSQSNTLNNDVSESRFRQAILVTDDGTACQNTAGGCAPLNIFGAGNISQDAIDFINVGATNLTTIEQNVFLASVAGELPFTLPGADEAIGLVLGFERRRDESNFRPDTFLSGGDVLGFNAGRATVGDYSSNEYFAELSIPILSGHDLAEELSLWGAFRSSDYSNIGAVTSYATALNYKPTEEIGVRVGYQRAVRAPNVSELFLGQSNGFPGATDPCSADGITTDTDTALCLATGVPAGQVGVFTQANSQIEGLFGGNPDLGEETSDTFTIGLVVEPLEGLDFTLDYFDIEIEDAISVLGGGVANVLDICYNVVKDVNSAFCQAITRRPDGNVDVVNVLNENIAKISTSGIDFNVNYSTEVGFGLFEDTSTMSVNFRSTFLDTFDVQPVADLPDVNECAGSFGNTCGIPRSKFQYNARVNWSTGPLTVSGLLRYLSEVDDDTIATAGVNRNDIVVPELAKAYYFDLSAAYLVTDDFKVNFGVRNLFEEDPTPVGDQQQQANTFPEVYDVLGRRFFLSGTYTF